jgi:hypothetical protein
VQEIEVTNFPDLVLVVDDEPIRLRDAPIQWLRKNK